MSIEVRYDRYDRKYREGENVTGVIVVSTPSAMAHQGIFMNVDGNVALHLSARTVGLFESFYSTLKPMQLITHSIEIAPAGKLPSGTTEFPFEFPLTPTSGKRLYDTYHGVYINVQYKINIDIQRGMLSKALQLSSELIVHSPISADTVVKPKPYSFSLSPESLKNVKKSSKHKIPAFLFEGSLDTTVCDIDKPFSGYITVKKNAIPIKSIEVQLVRVETCQYKEGEAREATEVQNIQIGDGRVVTDLPIHMHMVFPRLFTCSTLHTDNFRVEFEINIIVQFEDNHVVTENFAISMYRQLTK